MPKLGLVSVLFVKADYYFLRMGTDTKTEERTIPRLSREN